MGSGYYESALLRLRRVAAYFALRYGDAIKENNITPVQFEILLYVDSCGSCNVSDVAGFMVVDKSTSSRVLRGIEKRGWIKMYNDLDDRRCRRLSLTSQGQSIVDINKSDWLSVEKDIRANYDSAIEHLERN
jgi:DNA-binding MarR family transcriptional regulator